MANFLSRLFKGKKRAEASQAGFTEHAIDSLKDIYDPENEDDRIGLALLVILRKQLDLLNLEMGFVPADSIFASEKCRGALLGTALGILQSELSESTNRQIIDTTIAAFSLIYGDTRGRALALQTIREAGEGNSKVEECSDWALLDTKGVYKSGGLTSAAGFYLAASGMI